MALGRDHLHVQRNRSVQCRIKKKQVEEEESNESWDQ